MSNIHRYSTAALALALIASGSLRADSDDQKPTPPLAVTARGGDSGGRNGDDPPTLAYDAETLKKIEEGFITGPIALSKEEVDARTLKIEGFLRDYYKDATIARMKQMLESTYGISIFHYTMPVEAAATIWAQDVLPEKKGKKLKPEEQQARDAATAKHDAEVAELMRTDGIVRYYMNFQTSGSYFEHAPARSIPFRGVIFAKGVGDAEFPLKQVVGPSSFCRPREKNESEDYYGGNKNEKCFRWDSNGSNLPSPFVFTTEMMERVDTFGAWRFQGKSTSAAVFTTTENPLFEAPVLRSFSDAMNMTGLKALDATLVFLSNHIVKTADPYGNVKSTMPYDVIYPQNDPTAPIPRPVVFIGADATTDDLVQMLTEHAPQIYAYNQMFEAHTLPSLAQLESELKKYSADLPEVAALIEKVGAENARNALHATYLKITYGILAGILAPAEFAGRAVVGTVGAPLAVGAMLSRPVFRQIFEDYTNDHYLVAPKKGK